MLKAAIVGLGQVGLQFDEDRKRKGLWTHFSVYERLKNRFDLVAVCEPDASKRAKAVRRRPVRTYSILSEMLRNEKLDIVSLCTPPALHAKQILACAGQVRAIICEKPLGTPLKECRQAVRACERAGTVLAVNYYKRYEAPIAFVQRLLSQRKLGSLRFIQGLYTGPLQDVGSHLVDLIRFIAGELKVKNARREAREEGAYSAYFSFGKSGRATVHWAGRRHDLVFELDILGEKGRCRVLNNCTDVEWSLFKPSARYEGYRELQRSPGVRMPERDRFLPLFEEVAEVLAGHRRKVTSDGRTALYTQEILERIERVAAR